MHLIGYDARSSSVRGFKITGWSIHTTRTEECFNNGAQTERTLGEANVSMMPWSSRKAKSAAAAAVVRTSDSMTSSLMESTGLTLRISEGDTVPYPMQVDT